MALLVLFVAAVPLAGVFARRAVPARAGELTPPEERRAAAKLSFVELDGTPWSLEAHRGQVVVLNLWATWCGPCREEAPALGEAARALGSAVDFEGLSLDAGGATEANRDRVERFARSFAVAYPLGFPAAGSVLNFTNAALPTTLLFDRAGRLARTYVGPVTAPVLEEDARALLTER